MTKLFERETQGIALYLEFHHESGSMAQVIVTPDGIQESGATVSSVMFSRVINPSVTKKKWKSRPLQTDRDFHRSVGLAEVPFSVSEDLLSHINVSRLQKVHSYIGQLANLGYKLVKDTPIYVEVSKEDLTSVRSGMLPAKLWTRVKSVRSVLDFPEPTAKK